MESRFPRNSNPKSDSDDHLYNPTLFYFNGWGKPNWYAFFMVTCNSHLCDERNDVEWEDAIKEMILRHCGYVREEGEHSIPYEIPLCSCKHLKDVLEFRDRKGMDVFDYKFIIDSVKDGKLRDLNKYRIGVPDTIFKKYDANEILLKKISWIDLVQKQIKTHVSCTTPIVPQQFRRRRPTINSETKSPDVAKVTSLKRPSSSTDCSKSTSLNSTKRLFTPEPQVLSNISTYLGKGDRTPSHTSHYEPSLQNSISSPNKNSRNRNSISQCTPALTRSSLEDLSEEGNSIVFSCSPKKSFETATYNVNHYVRTTSSSPTSELLSLSGNSYHRVSSKSSEVHTYTSSQQSSNRKNNLQLSEMQKVLDYICSNNLFESVTGTYIWKEMARKEILKQRTWQTLKNNFQRVIMRDICSKPNHGFIIHPKYNCQLDSVAAKLKLSRRFNFDK